MAHEDEDDENDDDAGRRHRMDERREQAAHRSKVPKLGCRASTGIGFALATRSAARAWPLSARLPGCIIDSILSRALD